MLQNVDCVLQTGSVRLIGNIYSQTHQDDDIRAESSGGGMSGPDCNFNWPGKPSGN